jgi:hypothetical protein
MNNKLYFTAYEPAHGYELWDPPPVVATARQAAGGVVNFVFGPAFGQVWGAVGGVGTIHVHGPVNFVTAAADGAVTVKSQLTEKDFSRGDGVILVEDNIPSTIVVSPGSWQFTLPWCELPTFPLK